MLILQSIQPNWCELIFDGYKTIEIRKSKPRSVQPPFKVFVYCCKPKPILRYVFTKKDIVRENDNNDIPLPDDYKYFCKIPDGGYPFGCYPYAGNVIGEYICDRIVQYPVVNGIYDTSSSIDGDTTYLTHKGFEKYGKGKTLYGWHISEPILYDKPKKLGTFCTIKGKKLERPPQGWCYVGQ